MPGAYPISVFRCNVNACYKPKLNKLYSTNNAGPEPDARANIISHPIKTYNTSRSV